MTPGMLWNNLLSYSAQVLALVAAGALLPVVFRIRQPRAQLVYCQCLLVACLILPALQPWRRPVVVVPAPAATSVPMVTTRPFQPVPKPTIRFEEAALLLLAAGAAVRALWLLVGMWRLRRYRVDATPLYPLPEAIEAARSRTGAEATVCVSEAIDGPVTFGFLDPVILLPPAILEQPFDEQFAIACHEFLHVRRHDWLYTMCEELAGALFWFHPAVWWLLAQIRLAREQVVDRQVVSLTQARDPYVNALLAMAGARPRFDLAPAPLFLRKCHLTQRIRSLLKEVSMSKPRLVSSYVSIAAVLVLTTWFAATSFPLQGSAQVQVEQGAVMDGAGVNVQPGGRILHRVPVRYPYEALSKKIEGVVTLELTLGSDGIVSDAHVLSGPEELRSTALASVLQWHYVKDESTPRNVLVTIEFKLPPNPPPAAPKGVIGGIIGSRQGSDVRLVEIDPKTGGRVGSSIVAPGNGTGSGGGIGSGPSGGVGSGMGPGYGPGEGGGFGGGVYKASVGGVTMPTLLQRIEGAPLQSTGILERIDVSSLPEPLQNTMRSRLAAFEGQPYSTDLTAKVTEAARGIDSHVVVRWFLFTTPSGNASAFVMLALQGFGPGIGPGPGPGVGSELPAPLVQPNFPPSGEQRIVVGANVQSAKLIEQKQPEYPPLARQARISGTVTLGVLIDKDGHVAATQFISGHPLLTPAAVEAVKQWVYQPTLLNGNPVEVVTTAYVSFKMQ